MLSPFISIKSFGEIIISPVFYFHRLFLAPILNKNEMHFKKMDAHPEKLRSQFQIEVKVVLPGIRGLFDPKAHRQEGYPNRRPRFSDQRHPCFFRGSPPLFEITGRTTGYDIRPFRLPTFRARDDMVVSQFFVLERGATVLALSPIPHI
jgi:hypothetical protein